MIVFLTQLVFIFFWSNKSLLLIYCNTLCSKKFRQKIFSKAQRTLIYLLNFLKQPSVFFFSSKRGLSAFFDPVQTGSWKKRKKDWLRRAARPLVDSYSFGRIQFCVCSSVDRVVLRCIFAAFWILHVLSAKNRGYNNWFNSTLNRYLAQKRCFGLWIYDFGKPKFDFLIYIAGIKV